jgi:hypothetical protein
VALHRIAGRRLDCFRVRSGGESVVDLALPATKSGELLGAVPRRADAGGGTVDFTASRVGFGLEGRQGFGQALDLAFEAGDEVGGFAALPVERRVGDFDVGVGDGDGSRRRWW